MIRELGTVLRLAILRSLCLKFLVVCMTVILSVATAGGEVWIGPSVGLDAPVFTEVRERYGKTDPGGGVELDIRIVKQFDLVVGLYLSSLNVGNDADPLWLPALGIRWRRLLGNPQGTLSPFISAGAGLLFGQAELGLEIAPRSFIGLEAGIRERLSYFNSFQAFLLLRIGRQHIK